MDGWIGTDHLQWKQREASLDCEREIGRATHLIIFYLFSFSLAAAEAVFLLGMTSQADKTNTTSTAAPLSLSLSLSLFWRLAQRKLGLALLYI
jgi:hypothetical protein